MQTDATTPTNVKPTMLGVVVFALALVCKRMQQLPTMLGPAAQKHAITCNRVCKQTQHVISHNVRVIGRQFCVRLHEA